MRFIKWIVLGVLVLVIVVGVAVYLNLNSIIRSTVESQTAQSLKLETTLNSASLALFGGNLSLDDLKIGSPEGYAAPEMFTLGGVDLEVDYGQLRKEPIRIKSIHIRKPRLVIEQKNGKFNFEAAFENLPQDVPTTNDGQRTEGEPIKVIIDTLRITDATVILRPGLPGLDQEIAVPVPSVELKNIGSADGNENGAAIKDVAMQAIAALSAKAGDIGQIGDQLKDALNKGVGHVASQLSSEFSRQLGGISSDFSKGLTGALGSTTQEAGKVVEDLFKNFPGGKKKNSQDK